MLDRMPHQSMEQIQAANARIGHCWFSPANMRSFQTRLGYNVYSGSFALFFVTGEKRRNEPREYTIRYCTPRGNVETFGKFGGYSTRAKAERYAERAANLSLYLDQAECHESSQISRELWQVLKDTQAREVRRAQDEIEFEIFNAKAVLIKHGILKGE